MNLRVARLLQLAAVLVLLALAWLGIKGGIEQWPASRTLGQKTQSAAQFLYGVLSLLIVGSATRFNRFSRSVGACWLVALTIAGGAAPVVWGGAGWAVGIVAGLAACGVAVLVLWLLGLLARGLTSA